MKKAINFYVISLWVLCSIPVAQALSYDGVIDSINRLIKNEKDPLKIQELILQRAIRYPVGSYDIAVREARGILLEAQREKNNPLAVEAYITLGNINHKNKKYEKALGFDSLALKLARNESYRKGESLALGNIGRELYAIGRLEDGMANYQTALQLELSFSNSDPNKLLTYYNQLGVISRILGEYRQSVIYFDDGIRLAETEHNERLMALLYMNKANTLAETSKYEEAASMHLRSIEVKERLKDSVGLSQSYGNLAIVFKRAREYDKALSYFHKGKELATKRGDHKALGLAASNLAITLIAQGKLDSVRHFFDEAIQNFDKIKDIRGLGLVYHNYGNFLADNGQLDTAEIFMQKALAFREKVGSATELSSTLANLGMLNIKRNKFSTAEKFLLEAKSLLDTTQHTTGLLDVVSYLSVLYAKKGDYQTAFGFQERMLEMERAMLNESERVNILKAESKYELEKHDLELAFEKEKQRQRQFSIISVAALIVVALASVVSVLLFRYKQSKDRHHAQLRQLAQQHRIKSAKALRQAEEEQRKKIAGKLHDEVGALLSIAKLNVEQLQDDVFVADSEAIAKLHTTRKLLGEMSETVRGISHSLMPIALEKYGLKPAIIDLINAVNASGKINVEEVIEGLDDADRWNDEFRLGLYRIVQEVLNNVIKHAGASHVLVQIVELECSVTIYIEDNGKGLDSKRQANGVGLRLLKSNIEYFNGAIEINGRENQGTFVLIELPLESHPIS